MYNEFAKNITMESAPVRQTHYTTKVHIDAKRKTATIPIFTGFVAVLSPYNCQRWDYTTKRH